MGKSTKTKRLKKKVLTASEQRKQTTLDHLPEMSKIESAKSAISEQKKQIEITEVKTSTREDELELKVGFRLLPSRSSFSKITSDLYFNQQKISSTYLAILQSPLATDISEFTSVLNMKGIGAGSHKIKVDMYELWSCGEKLTLTSKEFAIEYVPLKREDRLIELPIVKSVAGADLVVVSDSQKSIYREIEENTKKEAISTRDEW